MDGKGADSYDGDVWIGSKFFPGALKDVFSPFSLRKTPRSREVQFHIVKVNPQIAFSRGGCVKRRLGPGHQSEIY